MHRRRGEVCVRRLGIIVGSALAVMVASPRAAWAGESPVNCANISAPSSGPWWVYYDHMDWWFALTATRNSTSSNTEMLSFSPSIATSQNEHGWQKLMWTTPGGLYNCFVRETNLGNGYIQVDWVHRSAWTTGSFNYVHNGDDCHEDYTDEYDEYNEEPPSNCPMSGVDGSDDDTMSEVTQSGNWSYLCTEFDLAPGTYNVYVDDVYQETINC